MNKKKKVAKEDTTRPTKFRVRYSALRPPISLDSYEEAFSFARNNIETKETGVARERKLSQHIEPYSIKEKVVDAEL